MDRPSLFIKCDCSCELLEVQRYDYDDELAKGFNFTFWKRGRINRPMDWKERFRWCWRILRTGDPWADSIIATDENAKKVSDYINKNL